MTPDPRVLSTEELRRNLLTADFRGPDFKERVLDELIRRALADV